MLWTEYRYKKEDYRQLLNVLRQPNKYRYGLLVEECSLKGTPTKFKVLKLPEGYLILSRDPKRRGLKELIDLKERSLKLIPYILFIPHKQERIRLQVNRDYLRLLLKRIRNISSSAYWYGSKRKFLKDYLKAVNNIVREANDLCSTCFVEPESIHAFNRKLRQIVFRYITSVLGLKAKKARRVIKAYLTTLKH